MPRFAQLHRAVVFSPLGWWLAYWWRLSRWREREVDATQVGLGGEHALAWAVGLVGAALVVLALGRTTRPSRRTTGWWSLVVLMPCLLHGGKAWVRWTAPTLRWRGADAQPGVVAMLAMLLIVFAPEVREITRRITRG